VITGQGLTAPDASEAHVHALVDASATEKKTSGERSERSLNAARAWFARRRTQASSRETVISVYDRTSNAVDLLGASLRDLGFDREITRVSVNTNEGPQQVPLACYRSASETEEVAVYALHTDSETVATSGSRAELAARAARYLTPIYVAADVLVVCLDPSESATEANDLADLNVVDALLSFVGAHISFVFVVNRESPTLRLGVESRLSDLSAQHPTKVRVLNSTLSSNARFDRAVEEIFEILSTDHFNVEVDNKPSTEVSSSDGVSPATSHDLEIERAAYEAVISQGARRLVLTDGLQTLFSTEDALEPNFDWSQRDEQIRLQLSGLALSELCSIALRTHEGFCTIDAIDESHQLFVAAMWDASHQLTDIQQRSRMMRQVMSDTFDRLRAGGNLANG
jgi:hypothetical protein